jgi:hypothetical protein
LAVVEEVSPGWLTGAERGQQLQYLLARDHAVALGAPAAVGGLLGLPAAGHPALEAPATRAQASAVDGHHVVQVEPHAHHAVGTGPVEGGHYQRQRAHEVRGKCHQQLALQQRLAHEPEVEVLQVAQPPVHQLAGAAGGARGVVGALHQRHGVAARGGVEGNPHAGDPATDHDHVELAVRERLQRLTSLDHARQSGRGACGQMISEAAAQSR